MNSQIHYHSNYETSCESNRDLYSVKCLGWCFWDETGDCHGPFTTEDQAQTAFEMYCVLMG